MNYDKAIEAGQVATQIKSIVARQTLLADPTMEYKASFTAWIENPPLNGADSTTPLQMEREFVDELTASSKADMVSYLSTKKTALDTLLTTLLNDAAAGGA